MFLITRPVAKECVAYKIATQNIPGQIIVTSRRQWSLVRPVGTSRQMLPALQVTLVNQFSSKFRSGCFKSIVFSFSSNLG